MGEINGKWITVNIDDEAIMMIDNAAVEALRPTMDFIVGDVIQNQYIPFDTGTLQNSRHIYTDIKSHNYNVVIEHTAPYAGIMYRGTRKYQALVNDKKAESEGRNDYRYVNKSTNFNYQTVNNKNARSKWYKEYQEKGQEFERVIDFYKNKVKQFSERYVE